MTFIRKFHLLNVLADFHEFGMRRLQ